MKFLATTFVFLLCQLPYLYTTAQTSANGFRYYRGSLESFEYTAIKQQKPYIIIATVSGCGNTLATEKACAQDSAFAAYAESHFLVKKVNVRPEAGDADGIIVMQKYGVRGTPAILMFEPSGRLSKRLEGMQNPQNIREKMDTLITEYQQMISGMSSTETSRDNGMSGRINADEDVLAPESTLEIVEISAPSLPKVDKVTAATEVKATLSAQYAAYSAKNARTSTHYTIRIAEFKNEQELQDKLAHLPKYWRDQSFQYFGVWVKLGVTANENMQLSLGSFEEAYEAEGFVGSLKRNLNLPAEVIAIEAMY